MILKKFNYFEHENENNFWKIRDVNLEALNLIVGLNATGKTRLINVISNLAKILAKRIKPMNGNWDLEFKNLDNNGSYKYKLQIENHIILKEEILLNENLLLQRDENKGEIFSYQQNRMIEINPPKTELTSSIRRDTVDFPFFEDLLYWADNFYGYRCTYVRSDVIGIPASPEAMLHDLSMAPRILEQALKNPTSKETIIKDLCDIGYPIKEISVKPSIKPNLPPGIILAELQEVDLSCPTPQLLMSQGMFRAFSIAVIIEHILQMNRYCTIAIDDLGEGLDYDRSMKLTKLIFKKIAGSKIQLIVTSNDRFLMNAVDIKDLNVLERNGHIVDSFNYANTKEQFDEFESLGLTVFDFFSRKMYKSNRDEKN